jgi:hypothetical protein
LTSYTGAQWHVACSTIDYVSLLAPHHARSRANKINAPYSAFDVYGAVINQSVGYRTVLSVDQSDKGCSHTATLDRHRGRSVCGDYAPADRMRPRTTGRQRIDRNTSSSHRISRMASGSRPFSHCLLRPLRQTITGTTRQLHIRKFHVRRLSVSHSS